MEHICGDGNDENESEEERSVEMVTSSNDLEDLEDNRVDGPVMGYDDGDDDIDDEGLNFLDDGGTE